MSRRLLDRLLGRDAAGPSPPARLSADAARRIADGAVAGLPMADLLMANGREMADGRLVWRFWTPTRGAGIEVAVDDATGEATVKQWHGR